MKWSRLAGYSDVLFTYLIAFYWTGTTLGTDLQITKVFNS